MKIFTITLPRLPFRLPNLPPMNAKSAKIITAITAIIVSLTMVGFVAFTVLTNSSEFKKKHNIISATEGAELALEQSNSVSKSDAALPGGGIAVGTGGTSGTNSPVVTLTAEPASVVTGKSATLKWSVTNDPISCVASDDWSGDRAKEGTENTQTLSIVQTYIYTLTCKTATGTGFATVSVGATSQSGTGNAVTRPTVTLAATPSSVYAGESSTLSWSATNNPTSCEATGDWSGSKQTAGPEATPKLNDVKSYSYTLTCKNVAGTGTATATVAVVNLPPDYPVVSISQIGDTTVLSGASVTLNWSTANSPTSCTGSGDWSGSKGTSGQESVGPLATGASNSVRSYTFTLSCSNETGTKSSAVLITVVPAPPSVSLSVTPSSIFVGSSSTITWSSTNSPTSCVATGDWPTIGTKTSSGSVSTGVLNTSKTYYYSLTCTNSGGQGVATNIPLIVSNPSAPVVTISASPSSITAGSSSVITWSSTNSPTSCTASSSTSSWSGTKTSSGNVNTGVLASAGTLLYTLSCSNAGGTGSATTSVTVNASGGGGPTQVPVVSISLTATSIGTGGSTSINWSSTNSPTSCTASSSDGSWSGTKVAAGSESTGVKNTAGTMTFTLTCTNTIGSSTPASATLTVIAVPVVTISANPTSITAGASSALTWSATNSPTSCTASGNWSGTKASTGTNVTTGALNTVQTYTFTLTCANAGGTGPSASASVFVSAAPSLYCVVASVARTPCYGPNDLAVHSTVSDCWGYNVNRVVNMTSMNSVYHNPQQQNLFTGTGTNTNLCGNVNLGPFISGTSKVCKTPGVSTCTGTSLIGSHNHGNAPKNNTGVLASYLIGYYDAAKP